MADIVQLGQKLTYLYGRHPTICSNEELAKALKIDPRNISYWIYGSPTQKPNRVPDKHVNILCDIFSVRQNILLSLSFNQFKAALDGGIWLDFVKKALRWRWLRLVRCDASRGLVFPKDRDKTLETFNLAEQVQVSLTLPRRWAEQIPHKPLYLALFSIDQEKTTVLVPSKAFPDARVFSPVFTTPSFNIEGPTGDQSILILLTAEPLPDDVALAFKEEKNIAPHLALLSAQLGLMDYTTEWVLLKKEYRVI